MTEPYLPIDCGLHDRLEDLAVRRIPCRIKYEESDVGREAAGIVLDIYVRGGAEYLRLDSGVVIRLDRLRRVIPGTGPSDAFELPCRRGPRDRPEPAGPGT